MLNRKVPRVFVFCNCGADDHVCAGPVTVAEARRFIASQKTDGRRIVYFTVPASKYSRYCKKHAVADDPEFDS